MNFPPPTRLAPNPEAPTVVVTGKTTGHLVFGKLQRAAQLPGSRLGATPFASVDDRGSLSSVLWSSFAMASVASGCWLDRRELTGTYALEGSLLFIDATTAAPGGGFNPLALFAPKPTSEPGVLDTELLQFAAARGATHLYLMLDGDDDAIATAVDACRAAIEGLTNADGSPVDVGLCATIVAPVSGCALQSTSGWVADTTAQDHEGVLSQPIALVDGCDEDGVPLPISAQAAGSVTREDFAELVVQSALRLARNAEEGAPAVRVMRVAPAGADALVDRPLSGSTYEGLLAGPKTRAKMGTVSSADWTALLSPWGVVRKADPNDYRCLIDAKITQTYRSPA